jgi:hypothetical protein
LFDYQYHPDHPAIIITISAAKVVITAPKKGD